MTTKEPGYVYILTNPSFREDWVKIGCRTRECTFKRIRQYSGSSPL